ncbi:MAG TPA: hypothetical protein VFW71_01000 [Actinomycetota bacterium]|nr:hypothetical protein [Actinomycetota bacterium]
MVIIKTTCPTCGEVDLTADRVELRIAIGGAGSSYAFDCPRCCERIRKPADSRVVQLLISGGVAPEIEPAAKAPAVAAQTGSETASQAAAAAKAQHPSRAARPAAPPISYDDLLEFHRELEAGVLESFLRSAAA